MDREKESVSFYLQNRNLIASLECEIDHHTARQLREAIDRELFCKRPQLLTLDFSGVRFMDSSGIALILGRVEAAETVGAGVRIRGLSSSLQKLVRLSGLEHIKNLTLSDGR